MKHKKHKKQCNFNRIINNIRLNQFSKIINFQKNIQRIQSKKKIVLMRSKIQKIEQIKRFLHVVTDYLSIYFQIAIIHFKIFIFECKMYMFIYKFIYNINILKPMLSQIADQQQQLQSKFKQLSSRSSALLQITLDQIYQNIIKYLQIDSTYRYKLLRTMKLINLKKSNIIQQENDQKQQIYCLLEGRAIIRKMTNDNHVQSIQQNTFKRFTILGLHNYRSIIDKHKIQIQAQDNCTFLTFELPQKLTYYYQLLHQKKKQFLFNFFGIEKLSRKYNQIFDYFKYVTYTKGYCLSRQQQTMDKLIIVEEGMCSYFKNIYTKEKNMLPYGKLYNLFKRGPKSLIGAEFLIQNRKNQQNEYRFPFGNHEYFYEFKLIPKFNVFVDSSQMTAYEINLTDLDLLPHRQINHLKKICREQIINLQKSANQRLQKHIQVIKKHLYKDQNQKEITQTHINLPSKKKNQLIKISHDQFNPKISQLMNNKVKQQRAQTLNKKVIMTVSQMNKSLTSSDRIKDFKNILNQKIQQKQKIVQNYIQKMKQINQKVEENFKNKFMQIIYKNHQEQNNQIKQKSNIATYKTLLDAKQKIVEQRVKDIEPLLLLQTKSTDNVFNKQFQMMLFPKINKKQKKKIEIDHTSTAKKVQKIKDQITKKIDNSNKIKEQYMTIKSDFDSVQLNVIRGYQSMKQFQKSQRKSTNLQNQQNQYNILLNMLKGKDKKDQEPLEKVHQRNKFLRKTTMQKYNHQQHLKSKMKLHRYSITTHTFFKKDRKSNHDFL